MFVSYSHNASILATLATEYVPDTLYNQDISMTLTKSSRNAPIYEELLFRFNREVAAALNLYLYYNLQTLYLQGFIALFPHQFSQVQKDLFRLYFVFVNVVNVMFDLFCQIRETLHSRSRFCLKSGFFLFSD